MIITDLLPVLKWKIIFLIKGYNSKREFIVTQGCLASTVDDFWRMVWEQNCSAIIMLTRCMEKARVGCNYAIFV